MKCIKCGNRLKPISKFCIYCGTSVLEHMRESVTPEPTTPKPDMSTSIQAEVDRESAEREKRKRVEDTRKTVLTAVSLEKKKQAEAARIAAEEDKRKQVEAARKAAEEEKQKQIEASRKDEEEKKQKQVETARKDSEKSSYSIYMEFIGVIVIFIVGMVLVVFVFARMVRGG